LFLTSPPAGEGRVRGAVNFFTPPLSSPINVEEALEKFFYSNSPLSLRERVRVRGAVNFFLIKKN
jgi:hypothetical protein